MDEGIYRNMPRHEYDKLNAVGHSMLCDFERGRTLGRTRRLFVGNAFHRLLDLNSISRFDEEYPLADEDVDLTSKEGKQRFVELKKIYKSDQIIRTQERQMAVAMYESVIAHPLARKVVESDGESEMTIVSKLKGDKKDKIFGAHDTVCKGRLDKVKKRIWDFKTTGCLDDVEFKDSIIKFNYDSQFAMYRELYASVTGEYKQCGWVCVSVRPPYNVFIPKHPNGQPLPGPYMLNCGLRRVDTLLTFYERFKNGRPKESD